MVISILQITKSREKQKFYIQLAVKEKLLLYENVSLFMRETYSKRVKSILNI